MSSLLERFSPAKIKGETYGSPTATYTSQVRGGPTVVDIQLDDEEIWYPYAIDGQIDFMPHLLRIRVISSLKTWGVRGWNN